MMNAVAKKFIEPPQIQMLNQLWKLQKTHGYISDEAIKKIAQEFNIADIEVEGVVSFYHFFHRRPTGKYT
ncbi:MAG: NAD(P)H-dependent oxidoreductase subunit E, partial [Bacteroidia bacterium]|nr:NAD(P)H-dependent oxidoreductase subunit E [Bacteroidia bacterium]